jgi:hypothetical protein
MANERSGRPGDTECPSWAKGYVALVPGEDAREALREQRESTPALLSGIDEKTAGTFAYEPGKWTIKQILGHICDTERIFNYRALRLARGDDTPLPGFDQDTYVPNAKSNDRTMASLLTEFRSIRQSSLTLLDSLEPNAWERTGVANGAQVSVRGVAFLMAGHELHHVKIIRERYLPKL